MLRGDIHAELVGQTLLYSGWWLADGWQRCTVARLCPRGIFSPVVTYTQQTLALHGAADTLPDATSYGQGWVLLSSLPDWTGLQTLSRSPAGPYAGPTTRVPCPDFQVGLWLITAGPSQASPGQRLHPFLQQGLNSPVMILQYNK